MFAHQGDMGSVILRLAQVPFLHLPLSLAPTRAPWAASFLKINHDTYFISY